jgi:hypothetical protein
MKEISMIQKQKALKLFLSGLSYDEIAQQAGIAKGSVVNIVDEFREGNITLTGDMTAFVDALRKLTVDMKKHDTSITQLQALMKLHGKMEEMGVDTDQVELWLDTCQMIATLTVNNNQFIKSALELAEFVSGSGKSLPEVINEYNTKLRMCQKLEKEIAQLKDDRQQQVESLDAINKSIKTAQDLFQEQKEQLKAELAEFMTQHKLSWNKVKIAAAVLTNGLKKSGLDEKEIKKVEEKIVYAGSLPAYIKELESEKMQSEEGKNQLTGDCQYLESKKAALQYEKAELEPSVIEVLQEKKQIADAVELVKIELSEVQYRTSGYKDLLGLTYEILAFLASEEGPADADMEHLIQTLMVIREQKLGYNSFKCKNINGQMIYECPIPQSFFQPGQYSVDFTIAKEQLATMLVPLVKNKFMPMSEWNSKQLKDLQLRILKLYDEIIV